MSFFTELISFPQLLNAYKKNYKLQRKFMASSIEIEIANALKTNDGSISEKDIKKIRTYYGIAVPAILGEGYALLRSKPISDNEREIQTYLGSLTGLFDDLFDDKGIEETRLLEMVNNPSESQPKTSFELLFIKFYLKALSLGDKERIIEYLNKVFDAQVASKEQVQEHLESNRISEITMGKGGISIQFYRSGFKGTPSEAENEMLYNLGALGQLENDIFDIYKDYHDGIKTLATTCNSIKELSSIYQSWIDKYEASLAQIDANDKAKKAFNRFTRVLYLRGKVCLNQLLEYESKIDGNINLSKCKREDLICDMGKLSNQIKLLSHFLKG